MCSYFYNWFYGYDILEQVDIESIAADATHILLIKSQTKIKARIYKNINDFCTININKIELYYNNITSKVYSEEYSDFYTMTLGEFINYILPKNDLDIYHIPIKKYIVNDMKQDFFEKVYINDGYMCKCKTSCNDCIYHKLISENLYKKYIKNDSSSENTNCRRDDDDGRGLV